MVNVSVIIPVYNVERYLCECLDSLLSQTLDGVELICVNDGSTDNSGDILEKYAGKYSNIIVINQTNQGQSAARNNAISYAKGKYITFVDSDDFVDSDMLYKMFRAAEDNDCPLVICDCLLYWPDKTVRFNVAGHLREGVVYDETELYKALLDVSLMTIVCGRLYRRDIWQQCNLIFPVGQIYEDILLSFQIAHSFRKAMFVKDFFYKYRMREDSSVATPSPKKVRELIGAISNVNHFMASFVNPFPQMDSYLMCFNISYGLYAQQLNSLLPPETDLKSEIYVKIHMNCTIPAVLFNRTVRLKLKVKYLCYRLGILYKKKKK